MAARRRGRGESRPGRRRRIGDRAPRPRPPASGSDAGHAARGTGDAEATRIYAEAYGRDPEFYAFQRSLEAYRKSIGAGTTLVLSPDTEFFRFLRGSSLGDGAAPR